MPVTMESFFKHVQTSSNDGLEKLKMEWLPECCEIVDSRREEVEAWMPQDDMVSLLNLVNIKVYCDSDFVSLPNITTEYR